MPDVTKDASPSIKGGPLIWWHLFSLALTFPLLLLVASIPIAGSVILWALLYGVVYLLFVAAWAIWGSYYLAYLLLLILGWAPLAALGLVSSLHLLAAGGGNWPVGAGLLAGLLLGAVPILLLQLRQWRAGPPPREERWIDRDCGCYDLGGYLAPIGLAGHKERNASSAATMYRLAPLPILLLLSGAAMLAVLHLGLSADLAVMVVLLYALSTAAFWIALAQAQRLYRFSLWQRQLGRPWLVTQFATRRVRPARWSLRLAALLGALILLFGSTRILGLWPGSLNRGENGLWLGIEWTMDPSSDAQAEQLVHLLQSHQVRYLYVYTNWFQEGGVPRHPLSDNAAAFVRRVKSLYPDSIVLAWVGVPLPPVALDPATRGPIVEYCRRLVQEAGFDGLHLDVEFVLNGSDDFLALLQEVRAAIGSQPLLSIASPVWQADPGQDGTLPTSYRWTSAYYRQAAALVDQIAVMTYDSGNTLDSLYELWLAQQVRKISHAVAGTGIDLLFGVPNYNEKTVSHDPRVENIASGIRGVRLGMAFLSPSARRTIQGISPYAAWEMDETSWAVYRRLWLGR